jgi:hypothetical protein
MEYNKEFEEFIQKNKFQWINVVDKKGKEYSGRLMKWNKNGIYLNNDNTEVCDSIIELHGTGILAAVVLIVNEIKSIKAENFKIDGVCYTLEEAEKLLTFLNSVSDENWEIISDVDNSYNPPKECFNVTTMPNDRDKAWADLVKCQLLIKKAIDLNKIFEAPKIVGIVDATKNWSGTEGIIDPYEDVIKAIHLLPYISTPDNIITNKRTGMSLKNKDVDEDMFGVSVMTLFQRRRTDSWSETFKISEHVPNDIALLVSNHNEIVVINTEPHK